MPRRRTWSALDAWVRRRELGEPLAWITGWTTFCGRLLRIAPGVYVPRAQSEELARRAARLLPERGRALDLCAGSGAVATHLMAAVPSAEVVAVEIDARAAVCARANGVAAVVADLASCVRRRPGLDLVTAVAPYVPTDGLRLLTRDVRRYEPRVALDGGADGLDIVRRIIAAGAAVLRPGGWLLVEVGGDQDRRLAQVLRSAGYGSTTAWWDDDGDLRGVAAQLRNQSAAT